MFTQKLGRLTAAALIVVLAWACSIPPIFNQEVASTCRAHAGNVLIFRWSDRRAILPIDQGFTVEQDAARRARLRLPLRTRLGPPSLGFPIHAVEPFENGWLIGTDGGEWGGALYFVREGEAPREVARGNVRTLMPSEAGVYAFFGLAHLGSDEGYYRLISSIQGTFDVGNEVPLPGSPIVIARKEGALFIAGGFENGRRTWGRVFDAGKLIETTDVSPACWSRSLS